MVIISKGNLRTINVFKNVLKATVITIAMIAMLLVIVGIMYKPAYVVTIGNDVIGYIDNKEEFNQKVDGYINQERIDIAYIDMQDEPQYTQVLVEREKIIDNDKIYQKVIDYADVYSRVHVVFANDMEIATLPIQEDIQTTLNEIIESVGNTNVHFDIKEAHLINPEITTNSELIDSVNAQYKAIVKQTALSTIKKTNRGTYIDTGIEFESPLKGYITSRYGYRDGGEFHTGLDIAKPIGTPIYAAATGEVIYSGVKGTYGNCIIIQHADNVITYYAHCKDLLVEKGDFVVSGTQIATIGMTGRTTGPHLHFEVRINGDTVNPEHYIDRVIKE